MTKILILKMCGPKCYDYFAGGCWADDNLGRSVGERKKNYFPDFCPLDDAIPKQGYDHYTKCPECGNTFSIDLDRTIYIDGSKRTE